MLFRVFLLLLVTMANSLLAQQKLSSLANPPDWKKLDVYQDLLTREQFEGALNTIYTDGTAYKSTIKITDEAADVLTQSVGQEVWHLRFRNPQARARVNVKSVPARYWRKTGELPALAGRPPLSDLKIALDPGHIGGRWAQMEERYFKAPDGTEVMEGELTLQVAQQLKQRLEGKGAQVFLVRDKNEPLTRFRPDDFSDMALRSLQENGIPVPTQNYQGYADPNRLLTVQWQKEKLFYRVAEIMERARRINEDIQPDLVLALHLNAEPWADPANPALVEQNHFHLLINGTYLLEEMATDDIRYGLMLRLCQGIHEEEMALAAVAAPIMGERTGLPPYQYIRLEARKIDQQGYVWSRNLLANRVYECPVLYYEPFVMNNTQVVERLKFGHYMGRTLINGQLQPSIFEAYVDGVTRGLLEYYGKRRKA